jgi:hypothetical protein
MRRHERWLFALVLVGCTGSIVGTSDGGGDDPIPCVGGCAAGQVCSDGRCVRDPCADVSCPPGNHCSDGACVVSTLCDGVVCPNAGEICADGYCVPDPCAAIVCPTGTSCEHGVCVDVGGCAGTPCDGPSEVCYQGECLSPETCDDGDLCTADHADPQRGCVHDAVDCDDGDLCTEDGCDPSAGCVHAPATCDDGDLCTVDQCDGAGGCSWTPGAVVTVAYSGEAEGTAELTCGEEHVIAEEAVPYCGTASAGCELDRGGQLRAFGRAGSCGSTSGPWVTSGCSEGCIVGYCLECCFP